MTPITLRRADIADAAFVLKMSELAGKGFLPHFFSQVLPPGTDLHAYMLSRVSAPEGKMSFTKCRIAEGENGPLGMINLDEIPDPARPVDPGLPAMFQPLAALEAACPGSTVIEFLATDPAARGKGVAKALLEQACKERGPNGLALVVSDSNLPARSLYDGFGFSEVTRRPIVTQGWQTDSTEWILMTKP
jgi:GNAT superfamily N-acetyltransferase